MADPSSLRASKRWLYWAAAAAAAAGGGAMLYFFALRRSAPPLRAGGDAPAPAGGRASSSAQADFDRAVSWARSPAGAHALRGASLADKLELYAYFKQAREGACGARPAPGAAEWAARAKWEAWRKVGDMPHAQAVGSYVARLDELVPGWRAAAAAPPAAAAEAEEGGGGGGGDDSAGFGYTHTSRPTGALLGDDGGAGAAGGGAAAAALAALCARGGADDGDAAALAALAALLRATPAGAARAQLLRAPVNAAGETALHLAADAGRARLVRALLAAGADARAAEPAGGATPLHYAVLLEHAAVARALAAADAHAARTARDADGATAADLGLACAAPDVRAVFEELAAAGAVADEGAARDADSWVHVVEGDGPDRAGGTGGSTAAAALLAP
jgi:acyl-CoA-binding protein